MSLLISWNPYAADLISNWYLVFVISPLAEVNMGSLQQYLRGRRASAEGRYHRFYGWIRLGSLWLLSLQLSYRYGFKRFHECYGARTSRHSHWIIPALNLNHPQSWYTKYESKNRLMFKCKFFKYTFRTKMCLLQRNLYFKLSGCEPNK